MDFPSKEKAREKVKYKKPSREHKGVSSLDLRYYHTNCAASHVGHGNQGAYWLPGSYSAGKQPEA